VRFILLCYNFETPVKVFATAAYQDNDKENGVIRSLNAILWFKDGKMAKMDCSFDLTIRHFAEISGDKSSIRIDDFVMGKPKAEYTMTNGLFDKTIVPVDECIQESELIDCFSNGIDESWGEQTLKTQLVCDVLCKSAIEETPIEL
jgi:predicted dehydrogenase